MTIPNFRLRRPLGTIGGPFPHGQPSIAFLGPLKSFRAGIGGVA